MERKEIIEILGQQLQLLSEYSKTGIDELDLAKISDAMVKIATTIFAQTENSENKCQP